MTRYGVDEQECYPFCTLLAADDPLADHHVELTDAEKRDYDRLMHEFNAWQERLRS